MKNFFVLSSLLCCTISIHPAENAAQDWRVVHTGLENHYKEYVKKQLIAYTGTYRADMYQITNVGYQITKRVDVLPLIFDSKIRDDKGNTFLHIAVQKKDIGMVEWILNNDKDCLLKYNANYNYPFDVCVKHFSPEKVDTPNTPLAVRQIFDILVSEIIKDHTDSYKTICLSQIIKLQLKYKKACIDFVVDDAVLKSLVPKDIDILECLAREYKKAKNSDDHTTFGHLFVMQKNPDELCEWVKKGWISFSAKNKAGQTLLDIAEQQFSALIQDNVEVNVETEDFKKFACCVYILLNSLKREELGKDDTSYFTHCCDRHVL